MRVPVELSSLLPAQALPAQAWPAADWDPLLRHLKPGLDSREGTERDGLMPVMPHLLGVTGPATRALAHAAVVHGVRAYQGAAADVMCLDAAGLDANSVRWASVVRAQADVMRQQGTVPVLVAENVAEASPQVQKMLAILWNDGLAVVAVSLAPPGHARVPLQDFLANRTAFHPVQRVPEAVAPVSDDFGVPSYRSAAVPSGRAPRP